MATEIKIVEPVDFAGLATEHNRKAWILKDFKKLSESEDNVFHKLMALCDLAKHREFYEISGLILDVIKVKYATEYQQYLMK